MHYYYCDEEEVVQKCLQNETSKLYRVYKLKRSEDRFWHATVGEFSDLAAAQNLINTMADSVDIFIIGFKLNRDDNTLITTNYY